MTLMPLKRAVLDRATRRTPVQAGLAVEGRPAEAIAVVTDADAAFQNSGVRIW
jgi:hypothetical protein